MEENIKESSRKELNVNDLNYVFCCTKCNKEKPNSKFYYLKTNNNKIRKFGSRCRKCINEDTRKWQLNNKEARRKIANKWSENNKESKALNRKKYRKNNPISYMLQTSKHNAKKRGFIFEITKEDIENLLIKQDSKCYYTGWVLKLSSGCYNSMSIDRVDSLKGYTKENIVLCQYKVNVMKNNASVDDLLKFCKAIVKTFKNKKH